MRRRGTSRRKEYEMSEKPRKHKSRDREMVGEPRSGRSERGRSGDRHRSRDKDMRGPVPVVYEYDDDVAVRSDRPQR